MKTVKKGPRSKGKKGKRKFLWGTIERVGNLITQSERERGQKSEEFVATASKILKDKGEIINYYLTSPIRRLDKRGIDIIYQTENGFYLIQVKSSGKGAEEHRIIQLRKKGMLIYVIVRSPGQGVGIVINKIRKILKDKPSCVCLPNWILEPLWISNS